MKLSRFYTTFFLFLLLILSGCNSREETVKQADNTSVRKAMEGTNRLMLDAEKQDILDFIDRYGWEMKETGSGLFYHIYEASKGRKAESGMVAVISYDIFLLSGDRIYSSSEQGLRQFLIGRGGVERGLEEAILLMSKGEKGRFIMPPHLAHGFPGDGVKIPYRATIIYDVELVDLK